MGVSPIVINLENAGRRSGGSFTVSNTEKRVLPVELVVSRIELQPDGKSTTTPDPDQFLIFPPQAVVPPNETQVFRIQYIGDPEVKQSAAYSVSVDEIPVKIEETAPADGGTSAKIQVVYSISTLVVVAPIGAKHELSMLGSRIVTDDKGEARAAFSLRNDGDRHAYLSDGKLTLELKDPAGKQVWRKSLDALEVRTIIGIGYIPPHASREFTFPEPLPAKEGTIEARSSLIRK